MNTFFLDKINEFSHHAKLIGQQFPNVSSLSFMVYIPHDVFDSFSYSGLVEVENGNISLTASGERVIFGNNSVNPNFFIHFIPKKQDETSI